MPEDQSRIIELTRTDQRVELTVQGVRRVFLADQDGDPWFDALRYLHRMATVLDGPVRVRTADGGGARFLVITPAGECYDESDPGSRSLVPGVATVPAGAEPTSDWLPGGEAAVRRAGAPAGVPTAAPRRSRAVPWRSLALAGAVTAVALAVAGLITLVQGGGHVDATSTQVTPRVASTPAAGDEPAEPLPAPTADVAHQVLPGATFAPQVAPSRRRTPSTAPTPSATAPVASSAASATPAPAEEPRRTRAPQPDPAPEPEPDPKPDRKPKPQPGPPEPEPEREAKQEVSVPPSPIDPLAP